MDVLEFLHWVDKNKKGYLPGRYPFPIIMEILKIPLIKHIILNITPLCNLGCVYCFEKDCNRQKQSSNMPNDIAFMSVNFLIDQLNRDTNNRKGLITFFGGEPVLNWNLIEETVLYTKNTNKSYKRKIIFEIVTNGVLLDKQKIDFLNRNRFLINISIDSYLDKIHDKLRPTKKGEGTFCKILNNIRLFKEKDQIAIRATLTKKNLQIFDYLNFFSRFKSIKSINLGQIISLNDKYKLGEEEIIKYKIEMNKYAESIIKKWEENNFVIPQKNLIQLMRLLKNKMKEPGYCRGGRTSISISGDGSIYPCEALTDVPDFYLGNIKYGINQHLRSNLLKKLDIKNKKDCLKCPIRNLCGTGCFFCSYLMEGNIKKTNRIACELEKYDFKIAQQLLDKFNELK